MVRTIVRGTIGLLGEIMVTLGVLCLLFVAWQLWWTDVESNNQQAGIVSTLEDTFKTPPKGVEYLPNGVPKALKNGDAFAIIRVPRFGADNARPVLQGTDRDTLMKGYGHYRDTAMPGEVGNFAVAGHRTTYGRPLHNIDLLVKGDRVIVETASTYFVYTVLSHEIVRPWETRVIDPVPDDPTGKPTEKLLTFTACHPKFSATERYVVHAELAESIPRAKGLPTSYLQVTSGKAVS